VSKSLEISDRDVLIVVDVQYDFCPGGQLAVPRGDEVIAPINDIARHFRHVIITQDWHPPGHLSFASSHPGRKPHETIDVFYGRQILWPDHCMQGSCGAEFHKVLHTNAIEAIFRKGTDPEIDSYSGFYDNGHKRSTGLAGYLREKGAKELYFCGLAADFCVNFTVKDALKEGFQCTWIEDATRALDQEDFKKIKEDLTKEGVRFIQSENLTNF